MSRLFCKMHVCRVHCRTFLISCPAGCQAASHVLNRPCRCKPVVGEGGIKV